MVLRVNGSEGAVSVQYAAIGDTAVAGSDFAAASGTLSWSESASTMRRAPGPRLPARTFDAASGTLTWPDGDADDRAIRVNIANDSTRESDETFGVTLSNATGGASLAFPSSATVTITDDDSSAGGGGSGDGSGGGGGGCFIPGAALLLLWRRRFHVTRNRAPPDPPGTIDSD
jgi:hypothetical protein